MTVGLRERKKQRTRDAIVRAAHELFVERGFAATTVSQIAEAAEVSRGTLFAYFASKDDIVFSDMAETREALEQALAMRVAGGSALEALRTFVIENLETLEERARNRRVLLRDDDELVDGYRARVASIGDVVGAAVARDLGEAPDDLRPRLVAAAASAVFSATEEHRRARSVGESREEVTRLLDTAFAFLRGGLAAISDEGSA